jgi:hypothetical protein
MFMRPGAVERWRVLNASVDGRGFKRVMVLNGQFAFKDNALWRVETGEGTPPARRLVPVTRADIEAAKLPIYVAFLFKRQVQWVRTERDPAHS